MFVAGQRLTFWVNFFVGVGGTQPLGLNTLGDLLEKRPMRWEKATLSQCPGGRKGLPSLRYGPHSNNQVGSIICNDNAFISS